MPTKQRTGHYAVVKGLVKVLLNIIFIVHVIKYVFNDVNNIFYEFDLQAWQKGSFPPSNKFSYISKIDTAFVKSGHFEFVHCAIVYVKHWICCRKSELEKDDGDCEKSLKTINNVHSYKHCRIKIFLNII